MTDPQPASETLYVFAVSTHRGLAGVVLLGVIATIVLVAAGVSIFVGAPPGFEAATRPMIIVGVLALAAATVLHRRRLRRLHITRVGDQHFLTIERESVRLLFPLGFSGDQLKTKVGRIPTYDVWLKLVDRDRRGGIFLTETRGAAYGPQRGWLTGIDRTVSCERFEARKLDQLAKLLAAVKAINAHY
jgi:hypothetical protein